MNRENPFVSMCCTPGPRSVLREYLHWDEWIRLAPTCSNMSEAVSGVHWPRGERLSYIREMIVNPLRQFLNISVDGRVNKLVMGHMILTNFQDELCSYVREKLSPIVDSMSTIVYSTHPVDWDQVSFTTKRYGELYVERAPQYVKSMCEEIFERVRCLRVEKIDEILPGFVYRMKQQSVHVEIENIRLEHTYRNDLIESLIADLKPSIESFPLTNFTSLINDGSVWVDLHGKKITTHGDVLAYVYRKIRRFHGWIKNLEENPRTKSGAKQQSIKSLLFRYEHFKQPPPISAHGKVNGKKFSPLTQRSLQSRIMFKDYVQKLRSKVSRTYLKQVMNNIFEKSHGKKRKAFEQTGDYVDNTRAKRSSTTIDLTD